jgi:hypothetical protein
MMAFGLILGSAAIATAIAFGLGGRDFAARMLDQWGETRMPLRPLLPPRIKSAPVQPAAEPDDRQPPLV